MISWLILVLLTYIYLFSLFSLTQTSKYTINALLYLVIFRENSYNELLRKGKSILLLDTVKFFSIGVVSCCIPTVKTWKCFIPHNFAPLPQIVLSFWILGDFPSSPVVKTRCFHCWGLGSIPGWGMKIQQPSWDSPKNKKVLEFLLTSWMKNGVSV